MSLRSLNQWFIADQVGILVGAIAAGVIVAVLLVLRWFGERALERDPEQRTWRSIIGRALSRTSIAFIIIAAADGFATYATPPPRLERIIDVAFIIAFALQGAVWGRELVLGLIARRVTEADGGSALANAMALIRILVSFTAFAIA